MMTHYKFNKNLKIAGLLIILLIIGNIASSQARQFRQIIPIVSPKAPTANLPVGAVPVNQVKQLDRGQVESSLRKVLDQWNRAGMAETLTKEFYDNSRLMDAMDTIVPRDAKLRLQSIQGIQTLQQYMVPSSDGERGEMVSVVSATARTQLEFEQPGVGFIRRPGINEFILEISTAAPP